MPAAATCFASFAISGFPISGFPRPMIQRFPSITPSTGAAVDFTAVVIVVLGPRPSNSAIESSSFSFEAGVRSVVAWLR